MRGEVIGWLLFFFWLALVWFVASQRERHIEDLIRETVRSECLLPEE